ncbi:tyrosine-type recombinase/integrase [Kitasatospora sp. NPDC048194]|uniref:tyrosine-type recombinase/integrase n=1 Tax=Kitasatospora sp. NPDC048194 TaxID=3364045 RepID=UPI00371EC23C
MPCDWGFGPVVDVGGDGVNEVVEGLGAVTAAIEVSVEEANPAPDAPPRSPPRKRHQPLSAPRPRTPCPARRGPTLAVVPPRPHDLSPRRGDLDSESARLFEKRAALQARQREKAGPAWQNTGLVFTQEDGSGYHSDYLTQQFKRLVELSGLPPITLHGLRHGAACIAHASGSNPKEISEQLGHSTIKITMDTYTNVLPEAKKLRAEAALAIAPRSGRQAPSAPAEAEPATATPDTGHAAVPAQASPAAPAAEAVPAPRPASGGRLAALKRLREKKVASGV